VEIFVRILSKVGVKSWKFILHSKALKVAKVFLEKKLIQKWPNGNPVLPHISSEEGLQNDEKVLGVLKRRM
jgi:hypothetical protein